MRSRVSEGWLRSWGQTSQPRPKYNERIEKLALANYPQVALLKQVKGVGTLITLTFLLTLEDAHRFRKSRDVGCYLGLQPGRRNSTPSSGDCVNRLAQLLFFDEKRRVDNQVAAPAETRTPNLHRAKQIAHEECGWKNGDSGHSAEKKNFVQAKTNR